MLRWSSIRLKFQRHEFKSLSLSLFLKLTQAKLVSAMLEIQVTIQTLKLGNSIKFWMGDRLGFLDVAFVFCTLMLLSGKWTMSAQPLLVVVKPR